MALIARALHELGEQRAAQPGPCLVVGNGRRQLSRSALTAEPEVAHDGNTAARERIDRKQCFLVVVIDF